MKRLSLLLLTICALAVSGCCDSIGCGTPITLDLVLVDPEAYPDGIYRVEIAGPETAEQACKEFEVAGGELLASAFPDCAEWDLGVALDAVDGAASLRVGTYTYWYPERVTVSMYLNSALQFVGETDLVYETYYADEGECTKCKRATAQLEVEL